MQFTNVSIKNYKGLRDTQCLLSDFVCVVGENNAGKSSLLQAILLFINGSKLHRDAFHNPEEDILITINLKGLTQEVLQKLDSEHRQRLEAYIIEEQLTLARRYSKEDGSSKFRLVTKIPLDTKYRTEQVDAVLRGKKGKEITKVLQEQYPSVGNDDIFGRVLTQVAAKDLVADYVKSLPDTELVTEDIPLPTGFDNSIRAILPEPIYIPAVKDLADELKTKEAASFGKLLNILLDVIEDDLSDTAEIFKNLKEKLNRIEESDGSQSDNRLERVKRIEATIQSNLSETFRNVRVELEIPPPDIKTILSSASILADDGVRGQIEHKGDGFKRAITFSILRTYIQLSQDTSWRKESADKKQPREKFIFLFEEPELYLHPSAQNILFDALSLISKRHQTIVTTHSPVFFSAKDTNTFVKIQKNTLSKTDKPMATCKCIDIGSLSEKDKFQLISFESSNQAFFSRHIVLVEGDSELIVFPHIAKTIDSSWDFRCSSTGLVKISGKGSFKRYRDFFKAFDVRVSLIADLDTLLDGFDKLEPSENAKLIRSNLLQTIDKIIEDENLKTNPCKKLIQHEIKKARFSDALDQLNRARLLDDKQQICDALNTIFQFELSKPRLNILGDQSRLEVVAKKRELLKDLRNNGVYILEKGAIEAYYPSSVSGADKPSQAQSFCREVTSLESLLPLCENLQFDSVEQSEFHLIFSEIFRP